MVSIPDIPYIFVAFKSSDNTLLISLKAPINNFLFVKIYAKIQSNVTTDATLFDTTDLFGFYFATFQH